MQTLIVLILLTIVASLGSALFYLLKDRSRSPRTVKALTFRIGLSIALFLFLLLGYQLGILRPHGLGPGLRTNPPNSAMPSPAPPPDTR
jgi:hypothetical protein